MAKDKQGNWFGRHKILTGILIFFVLVGIVGSSESDNKKLTSDTGSSNTKSSSTDKKEETSVAKIGQPVRDGKFEFTVNSSKCGETTIGTSQYAQAKAQGQFCRVNLTISNIGDQSQSLLATNQKLVDANSNQYSYSSDAMIYSSMGSGSSSQTMFNEINPGNKVTGDIIFDVPAATTPVSIILHDSAFSDGVTVNLQ